MSTNTTEKAPPPAKPTARDLIAKISAAQKRADASRKAAQAAKASFKRIKKAYKQARRSAKVARKAVKILRKVLAAVRAATARKKARKKAAVRLRKPARVRKPSTAGAAVPVSPTEPQVAVSAPSSPEHAETGAVPSAANPVESQSS